ncbi:MAG: (Fe-S)-binding protein [Bacteroidales bacterium]|nr:(Fe-S)-binding protein [Bacteroidales bacterium]
MIPNMIFVVVLIGTIFIFTGKIRSISRNIKLGKDLEIKDNKLKRWKLMAKVAIGQSKMVARPIPAIMHLFVYVGFIIVNFEMLEILIDGVFGTHRVFSFFGGYYNIAISSFEIFGLAVMFGCIIFLIRRNVIRLKRFWSREMTIWPRSDANIILITELFLMSAILIMNATDGILQTRPGAHYSEVGSFLVSGFLQPLFVDISSEKLIFVERFCWWFHIVGVFMFLNYIPYSKHFHVFLAFPNVYYSKLEPKGKMTNMPSITKEVKSMLDESPEVQPEEEEELGQFGAKDVRDFTWKNLMDAFTCTECGRCTSSCPANITGKKLSPRKVVMDVRDRVEYLGKQIKKKGTDYTDNKSLFDQITTEELWACTTCNACTEECPVNIDPVSIILDMRRYLVMEQASAPGEINAIFSNIENNGAPWQFSPEDRLLWTE